MMQLHPHLVAGAIIDPPLVSEGVLQVVAQLLGQRRPLAMAGGTESCQQQGLGALQKPLVPWKSDETRAK